MQVRDILKAKGSEVRTIRPDQRVKEAMQLLLEHRISCLPVIGPDNDLVGIVSDKDIFRRAFETPDQFLDCPISAIMTTNLIVGLEDDSVDYVAGIMTKNRIRHIPIVQNDHIVGLVSVGDVVKSHIENIEFENRYLKQYIDGSYPG